MIMGSVQFSFLNMLIVFFHLCYCCYCSNSRFVLNFSLIYKYNDNSLFCLNLVCLDYRNYTFLRFLGIDWMCSKVICVLEKISGVLIIRGCTQDVKWWEYTLVLPMWAGG